VIALYKIEFSSAARKELLKLPNEIQKRIGIALERIKFNPLNHLIKLVDTGAYRLRVGDYRVIIDMQHDKLTILVIKVSHRRDVYDF